MANSKLVNYTKKSPNHSGLRTHKISRITPHCVVGQLSVQSLGNCFSASSGASCNYGIGKDGSVLLAVDECNRSWCSSNKLNDQQAVTIECASDAKSPYAMNDKVYSKLVELCVDICKRNGKNCLLWIDDKQKALAYKPKDNEMLLTVHRWFANKECPGDWLYSRMGKLADEVTQALKGGKPATPQKQEQKVKVTANKLNIRSGPGLNYAVNGIISDKGIYTIVDTQNNFGKLKSGAGWISLNYVTKL